MRVALAAAVAVAAGNAAAAAENLPVNVPVGSVWRVDSTTTIEKKSSTGSSIANGQSAYLIELRDDARTRSLAVTPVPITAGQAPSSIVFEFAVDAGLTPKRVINWDDIRRIRIEYAEKAGLPPKMADDAKAMYAHVSAEAAANLLVSELPILALGQGTNLEVGRSFPTKDASLVGDGDAKDSLGKFTLISLDRAANRAVLTWSHVVPPHPFSDAQRAQFGAMVEQTNPKASKDLPPMSEEERQLCRFDVDVTTGLVKRAECDLVGSNFFVNGGGSGIEHQTTRTTITQTLQKKP